MRGFSTFPKSMRLQVDEIAQLEFEFTSRPQSCYDTTRTFPTNLNDFLFFKDANLFLKKRN